MLEKDSHSTDLTVSFNNSTGSLHSRVIIEDKVI